MARVLREVVLEGREITALFDTGSVRNYTLREVAEGVPQIKVKPYTVGIGGKTMIVHEECILRGEIDGLEFTMKASWKEVKVELKIMRIIFRHLPQSLRVPRKLLS